MSQKPSEKASEKKQRARSQSSLYVADSEKGMIKLKNRKCPRCGNIMAFHKSPVERWTCGSCAFTDFVKAAK